MRRLGILALALTLALSGCAAPAQTAQTAKETAAPTPMATPTPAPTPLPENPVAAFVAAYRAAIEPHIALLDAPVEWEPESLDGLLSLAQQPVRLQRLLQGPASLLYDGERWSIARTAEHAADACLEAAKKGYAFSYTMPDGTLVTGTLKEDVLRCAWREGETLTACCLVARMEKGWRCLLCMDGMAQGVWLAGDTLYYTRAPDARELLFLYEYEDDEEPFDLPEPAQWEDRHLRIAGDTAVMVAPGEEGEEAE